MLKPAIPVFPRRRPTRTYRKLLRYAYKPPPSDEQRIWGKSAAVCLRHTANLRPDAFTPISDLNLYNSVPPATLSEVFQYVKNDRSNRFQVVSDLDKVDGKPWRQKTWYIRARAGHSIPDVDISTVRITNPWYIPSVVYATTPEVWNLIEQKGIRPEYPAIHRPLHYNPNFIYFTDLLTTLPSSPEATDKEFVQLHIGLNIPAAMKAGVKFFLTKNKQVVSTGLPGGSIPPALFSGVQVVTLKREFVYPVRKDAETDVQVQEQSRS